jgi:hypothetical protein
MGLVALIDTVDASTLLLIPMKSLAQKEVSSFKRQYFREFLCFKHLRLSQAYSLKYIHDLTAINL